MIQQIGVPFWILDHFDLEKLKKHIPMKDVRFSCTMQKLKYLTIQ